MKTPDLKTLDLKTLHLITQTSLPTEFECALAPQDAVILLAEGVYQVVQLPSELTDIGRCVLYVVAEDLSVRGLENNKEKITSISYEDLPDLLFRYDRNITW